MGIDIDRFVDSVDEEFICSICRQVLENPLQTACEHAFCKSCITTWLQENANCPVDRTRASLSQLRACPRILTNMLNKLRVRCAFASSSSALSASAIATANTAIPDAAEDDVIDDDDDAIMLTTTAALQIPIASAGDAGGEVEGVGEEFRCGAVVRLDQLAAHEAACEHNPQRLEPCAHCAHPIARDKIAAHSCLATLHEMIEDQNAASEEIRHEMGQFKRQLDELRQQLSALSNHFRASNRFSPAAATSSTAVGGGGMTQQNASASSLPPHPAASNAASHSSTTSSSTTSSSPSAAAAVAAAVSLIADPPPPHHHLHTPHHLQHAHQQQQSHGNTDDALSLELSSHLHHHHLNNNNNNHHHHHHHTQQLDTSTDDDHAAVASSPGGGGGESLQHWISSMRPARVCRWGGMISTPDSTLRSLVRQTLLESGCPAALAAQLLDNAHETNWPLALRCLEMRQHYRERYDQYVTRKIHGKQAVIMMAFENRHMPPEFLVEPGIIMIFAHGVV